MSENVKLIFKRALVHYISILKKFQSDQELEFSNDIFQVSVQGKIEKAEEIIRGLDSNPILQSTLDPNRELLCGVLQSYIDGLEKMKELTSSKLRNLAPSIPTIDFSVAQDELELAKRIQVSSCFDHGYGPKKL